MRGCSLAESFHFSLRCLRNANMDNMELRVSISIIRKKSWDNEKKMAVATRELTGSMDNINDQLDEMVKDCLLNAKGQFCRSLTIIQLDEANREAAKTA